MGMSVLDSRPRKDYRLLRCISCEKMDWREERYGRPRRKVRSYPPLRREMSQACLSDFGLLFMSRAMRFDPIERVVRDLLHLGKR